MDFEPDYRHIAKVLYNQRPEWLPVYEHYIDKPFIEKVLGWEIRYSDMFRSMVLYGWSMQ